jgi:heat shock protein 4
VKRVLGEIFGLDANAMNYGLKTTMNADEAVARGSALQCAMLSSKMKVKPFNIIDRLPYGIVAHFDTIHEGGAGANAQGYQPMDDDNETGAANDNSEAKGNSVQLYQRNDEVPHKPRRITFRNKTSDFTIALTYDDASIGSVLPAGENKLIGKYTIRVPSSLVANCGPSDVRVTFNIDKHGIVFISSAQLMEEIRGGDEGKEASGSETKATEGKEAEGKSSEGKEGNPSSKRRFKRVDLAIDASDEQGLTRQQIKEALELEASMSYEDRLIVETSDKRNELESYIYSMRDKIDGSLKEYSTNKEKDTFKSLMNSAEDWLYNEGFETTKQEYTRKIEELRKLGNPVENRYNQHMNRPQAIDSLKRQIEMCKTFAANYDEAHAHITDEERDRIRKEVQNIEDWFYDSISKQSDLPLSADPYLSVESIGAKRTSLFNATNPIMIKPKPKPVPVPEQAKAGSDGKKSEEKEVNEEKGATTEQTGESKEDSKASGNDAGEKMDESK